MRTKASAWKAAQGSKGGHAAEDSWVRKLETFIRKPARTRDEMSQQVEAGQRRSVAQLFQASQGREESRDGSSRPAVAERFRQLQVSETGERAQVGIARVYRVEGGREIREGGGDIDLVHAPEKGEDTTVG